MAKRRNKGVCIGLLAATAATLPALAGGLGQPGATRTPPATPTNVQVSATPSGKVTVTWTDQSTNELGFRIIRERRVSASAWNEPAGFTVGPNISSYEETPPPGEYRYRLRAYNAKGNSSYTPRVEVTVSEVSLVPAMPRNLAVIDAGGGKARLTWSDTSSNETGFDIERQPTHWSPQRVSANTALYEDTTVGGSFAYRIRSVNSSGGSEFTPWVGVNVAPPGSPGEPTSTPIAPIAPAVIPGSGFAAATLQPPAAGSPGQFGYDAKAIARWDVVPFQTFSSDFNVGVVAFHINGIDRVDFSCNGGPWTSVREMHLNPQTGVVEYTARLRIADFATNGTVEVRAIVWPRVGEPRVLAGSMTGPGKVLGEYSLPLVASRFPAPVQERWVSPNGDDLTGTGSAQNPFATIFRAMYSIYQAQGKNDGGMVYLMAGDHTYGSFSIPWESQTENSWVTITRAPGLPDGAARLTKRGVNLYMKHVRVFNLDVVPELAAYGIFVGAGGIDDYLWIDRCKLVGPGRHESWDWRGNAWADAYVTDSNISKCSDAISGVLLRNVIVHEIGSDAFTDSATIINCHTYDMDHRGTGFHPDVLQLYGRNQNVIAYGMTAGPNVWGQGLFMCPDAGILRDIALVNCSLDNQTGTSAYGVILTADYTCHHVFFKNTRLVGPAGWGPIFSPTCVVFEDVTFVPSRPELFTVPGVTYRTGE